MEAYEKGKELIVEEIIKDAHAEADRIIKDANKRAEEKIIFAKKQAESIVNEARKKADEQIEALNRRYVSFIELETKKRKMKLRESVFTIVIERVKERLKEMVDEPDYRQVLKRWIYESAVGLYEDRGIIRSSNREINLIDDAMIKEIEEKLLEVENIKTKLEIDRENTISGQGILLFSSDFKRVFNNEISTRILRKEREIQGIIYDALLDRINV